MVKKKFSKLKLNTLVHSLSFCELSVQDIIYASAVDVSSVLVYCYHPPSLPFKPYIISVDMAWWSQPQLELDDLKLTIWGNNVLYCWYCYEFSQLLRLIMATYVLHSFDLHWLTLGSFMCTAKRKFNLNPVILLWVLEGLIEPSLQWNTKWLLNGF